MAVSLEYLAGFFDGEGCINISTSKAQLIPRVSIANTYLPMLKCVQEMFGGTICEKSIRPETCAPAFEWTLAGKKRVYPFLEKLLPHLTVKRDQAMFLLHQWPAEARATKAEWPKFLKIKEELSLMKKRQFVMEA